MTISGILNKIPAELGLVKFSENVGKVLDESPLINKIVILANFVFRIAMMVTFMAVMPFSFLPSFLLSAGASVFYRVTIERFCQYRFAMLSCAAAGAYEIAKPAFLALISTAAFSSLTAFGTALALMTPFIISGAAIVSVTNQNVNDKYRQMHPLVNKLETRSLPMDQNKHKDKQINKPCCQADTSH
jgi:hypothetical protein